MLRRQYTVIILSVFLLLTILSSCNARQPDSTLQESTEKTAPNAQETATPGITSGDTPAQLAGPLNPNPPSSPVKLIFIHHSTGGNWLAAPNEDQPYGDLGQALMDNNYFVSATNYRWGPDSIGSRTDIINWPEWFTGPRRGTYLDALYNEKDQNVGGAGGWPRLRADPGGKNEIVMFKSCFPNSDLYGNPDDEAYAAYNEEEYSVGNAKAIYNALLPYFASRQDKLFVVITAPPLVRSATSRNRAANARAFNNWLVSDWLTDYPHANVAVFDYYNVLTDSDNHHHWSGTEIEHIQSTDNNFAAYPSGDSHPSTEGQHKATAEFVPLLNIYYNRWKATTETPDDIVAEAPTTQTPTPRPDNKPSTSPATALVQPNDLVYAGAFRLPDDGERPRTFEYGGNAMTFNPDNDTLFIMGHDRIAYGDVPDGNQVAEITIPDPVISHNLDNLPYAAFRQGFNDVTAGFFTDLEEIPRVGMAYLNHPVTGPLIHLGWGQHMPPDNAVPTHGWFNADLAQPNFQGVWYIGEQSFDSVNGYLFEIPVDWADAHTQGRGLATGRYRDGGWSGMGPSLFAYRPWQDNGAPPPSGTHLQETVLLRYASSRDTADIEYATVGYQHPDEWEGGAWLTSTSGKTAVIFAGTKATGDKYWYGWVHPDGAAFPCVEKELVGEFTICALADGTPCPPEDLRGCSGHNDYRGWWSSRFDAQIIFYDPAQLAQVAAGTLEPWEPQPYASLDIDEVLYFNPPEWDLDSLGRGDQRRMRIGAIAYDRGNDRLYVLELFGDQAKPVIHMWEIQ